MQTTRNKHTANLKVNPHKSSTSNVSCQKKGFELLEFGIRNLSGSDNLSDCI